MLTPPHLGLHHVALRVRDVAVTRAFYVDVLGFAVEREVAGRELWLCHGADSVTFLQGDAAPPGALDHLGVLVPDAAAVAAWEAHLRRCGAPMREPTTAYDDGSVGCVCADPDGLHVQLLWHPRASAALRRAARPPTTPRAGGTERP